MKSFSMPAIRARMVFHSVWPPKPARTFFLVFFAAAGVLFVAGDYLFFRRVFANLLGNEDIGRALMVAVSGKLMSLVLMTTFTLLIFSTAVSSLSYLYLDEDLTLLLALPLKRWKLRLYRAVEGWLNAGYMVALLLIPVVAAYLNLGSRSLAGYVAGYAGLVLYLIIPSAVGAVVTILLARFFPARRVHQLLTVMTLVMICLLVVLFRMARPEALLNPGSSFKALDFVRSIRMPSEAYLPSTWLASLIVKAAEGNLHSVYIGLLKLGGCAAGATALLAGMLKAFHWRGYCRAQEQANTAPGAKSRGFGNRIVSLLVLAAPASGRSRAVLKRDALVFSRDPTQWGQVIILGAVVVIYLFNVRFMPTGMAVLRVAVAFWNLATLGFIVSAVAGRFAFTAVGAEGRAFFYSRVLPVNVWSYLWAKYLFTVIPLSLLAVTTLWASNRFLGVTGHALYFTAFLAAVSSLALSAMALCMGAMDPVFNAKNPAKAVMSAWGLGYMFLSLIYIGGLVILSAKPVYHYYAHLMGRGPQASYSVVAWEVGLTSLAIVILSFVLAGRRLRTLAP